MDLETENKIAAILLKEAAELRRQAQKEGALAYLKEPTVRCKPNSRFLTATVRGVQQANRVVEVNEMWRIREKLIELDNRIRESRHTSRTMKHSKDKIFEPCKKKSRSNKDDESACFSFSNTQSEQTFHPIEDEGLRDDEVEEFLSSRVKRGRGTVGSRMDETGPDSRGHSSKLSTDESLQRSGLIVPPERLSFLKKFDSYDDELAWDTKESIGSQKRCHKKHKSKEKSGHRKRDMKGKRH